MKPLCLFKFLFFLFILSSCSGQHNSIGTIITIKGKVGTRSSGKITIIELQKTNQDNTDNVIFLKKDNTFEKKITVKQAGYYQINFFDQQRITFILDKSNIELNVDGTSQNAFAEIKGSPDYDLGVQVQKIISNNQQSEEAKTIEAEFNKTVAANDTHGVEIAQRKYGKIISNTSDKVSTFLLQQPPSLGLINALQNNNGLLDVDKYFETYQKIADKFTGYWRENAFAKEYIDFTKKLKNTAIGQHAPEISLPNPNGQLIKLSSFKGKYILIDFWAKWCGPCRQENPVVVKAYNRFKNKNFDILGVSLDKNKADWVQAIKEDGLIWHHVSDLKYFQSQAAQDYNISGIPFSLLIDPSGIIIAKDLRGGKLEKKLEEVLADK